jgi:arginyl-tRNA synthetase
MLAFLLKGQQQVLAKLGVSFDNYYLESDLHSKDLVRHAVEKLSAAGKTYQDKGALWFRSTDLGDDKDRVLIREDGNPTYFAADIAYHLHKFERGFGHLIDIWGTDHHGYVGRLKGALQTLGLPPEKLEIIIGQLVTLYRGDEPIRMSKRTGEMITLEEVVEEIGPDAVRFFFAANDVNSHLDFDLELDKKRSNDNPVYYVQYAHARICGIVRKAAEQGGESEGSGPLDPAERALLLKISAFPQLVQTAARLRHPHRLTEYAKELATTFHYFYEKCRVVGNKRRMLFADAARITLKNVLKLIGVSAPESM